MILPGIMVAFGFLAFQATGFVQCEKLHEILTDEEFSKVFRTTRDNVPAYEVVPIMHDLYKRSPANLKMQFSAFGRNVDIHLDPSDGTLAGENTPVWLASAGSNGKVNYMKLQSNIVGSVVKSFVAPESFASFVVDESSINKPGFHGTFGDLTIVPVPARVQEAAKEEFKRLKREVPRSSRTLIPTDYHVIIKTEASPTDPIELGKQANKTAHHFNEFDNHRRKRFANDIIYPSILVVTDYLGDPGTKTGSDFKDEILYQLAFWNSVDLRFRDLDSPKVRLRIAGIVIGLGRPATPYIYKFLQGENFDYYQSIRITADYWKNQTSNPDFQPGAYNVVMTLTNCHLFDFQLQWSTSAGVARLAGFCENQSPADFTAVGIVHDDTKFGGINTAAHELGHILGASHDIDAGGKCAYNLGYIMATDKLDTTNMHHWSSCSLAQIKFYLGFANHCADVPANLHDPGTPIDRIAPGDILTAQQQCEALGYPYVCAMEPKMCEKLQCWSLVGSGIVSIPFCQSVRVGALDGTPCAPDAICVRGVCRNGTQIIR